MDKLTTMDYYNSFKKTAEQLNPATFEDLREHVKISCNNNEEIMKKFAAWENKLKLDREELKTIFNKK